MKQLCYPANVQAIEDIAALHVKRLVEHAVSLDSIYRSTRINPVSLRVKAPGSVVLAKLIRARWVIIGSSDNVSSELTIWEINSCSSVHLRARHAVNGQIIDGLVEDDGQNVRLAVTVKYA